MRPPTRSRAFGSDNARGTALALLSAIGLGLAVAVARYAYEGGANGLTVVSMRSLVLVAGLYVYCRATGRSLRLRRTDRRRCAVLGVLMVMGFYGNVGAVEYISIGLTALLFFTFPPLIALIQAVVDRTWPAPVKVVALATAFTGLATMLGVSLGASDPRGVAMALGAAVGVALNSVGVVRLLGHVNPLVAMFHMAVAATVVLVVLTVVTGSIQWPVTGAGWAGSFGGRGAARRIAAPLLSRHRPHRSAEERDAVERPAGDEHHRRPGPLRRAARRRTGCRWSDGARGDHPHAVARCAGAAEALKKPALLHQPRHNDIPPFPGARSYSRANRALSSPLCTFPIELRGSSSTKKTCFGTL